MPRDPLEAKALKLQIKRLRRTGRTLYTIATLLLAITLLTGLALAASTPASPAKGALTTLLWILPALSIALYIAGLYYHHKANKLAELLRGGIAY